MKRSMTTSVAGNIYSLHRYCISVNFGIVPPAIPTHRHEQRARTRCTKRRQWYPYQRFSHPSIHQPSIRTADRARCCFIRCGLSIEKHHSAAEECLAWLHDRDYTWDQCGWTRSTCMRSRRVHNEANRYLSYECRTNETADKVSRQHSTRTTPIYLRPGRIRSPPVPVREEQEITLNAH